MRRGVPALLGAAIVVTVLAPLVPLAIASVVDAWFFPQLIPRNFSARAWSYVVNPDREVLAALSTSLAISAIVCVLCILIGVPAGRALGLYRFRGQRLVEFILIAPLFVPPIAVTLGIHVAFIRFRLAGTLIGVALSHMIPALPYMVMVMKGVFARYDPSYEQQARSLGARRFQTILRVTAPLVAPGVATGALFVILISWAQYALTLVIGGGRVETVPVLLFAFAQAGDRALTGALGVTFLVPAVLILLATSRVLDGGAMAAGKGAPL